MLTVKVWASISATLTTEAPVWKPVVKPPADTVIGECAGQNPSGFHCRTRLLSQVNDPLGVAAEVNAMFCSAAGRLVIGAANITVTGCATPTVSPAAGAMLTTSVGVGTAAEVVPTDPVAVTAAMPT